MHCANHVYSPAKKRRERPQNYVYFDSKRFRKSEPDRLVVLPCLDVLWEEGTPSLPLPPLLDRELLTDMPMISINMPISAFISSSLQGILFLLFRSVLDFATFSFHASKIDR